MADNKRYYWLKLKNNWFNDKRIKKLRSVAGGDTYVIIYLKMQLLSLQNEGKLYFEGVEDNFISELALDLDEDIENVQVTVSYLEKKGLIELVDVDEYLLTEVPGMIGSEVDSAQRVRKHRKNKALQGDKVNVPALHCNGGVTKCNTEIDIDTEKDIEKETESDTDTEIGKVDIENTTINRIVAEWNALSAYGIAQITELNERSKRYNNLINIIQKYGMCSILEAIEKVKHSSFLQGKTKNDKPWAITFDWFVKQDNFIKVLEGNYLDREPQTELDDFIAKTATWAATGDGNSE